MIPIDLAAMQIDFAVIPIDFAAMQIDFAVIPKTTGVPSVVTKAVRDDAGKAPVKSEIIYPKS